MVIAAWRPVFVKAQGHARKRSSLAFIPSEARRNLGCAGPGMMGSSVGSTAEQECDASAGLPPV